MDVRRLLPLIVLAVGVPARAGVSERAYERAIELVDRLYLYPEGVDEEALLHAAARGVAESVDWLIVETDDRAVHLRHGDGTPVGSVSVASMETLPEALLALESVVRDAGFPIDADVELRLEVLRGMTEALDKYSRVLAGERLERFDVRLKGTLVGIGATLSAKGDTLAVTSLVDGGPAQRGGLMLGDVVVRIDGTSTVNMTVREAITHIRGDVETVVTLSVKRGDRLVDVPLIREEVVVPNVEHKVLDGNVGYVRIDHFSQRTVQNLVESLHALKTAGALEKGLVIDLRGNTGGSMKEAARTADQFLKTGLLIRTAGPDGGQVQNLQARMDATDAGNEPPIALAVLVDERTASGSEILAGALLELDRAVIVGSRTYGKGTVQKIYNVDDEARLKLTVAQYILANERSIADNGIIPDVTIAPIELDSYGVRFKGWEEARLGVAFDEVLPAVVETEGWRGEKHPAQDVVLEVGRRAVLRAEGAERAVVLRALREVAPEVRGLQEQHLVSALEARGISWSVAPRTSELPPGVSVKLSTRTEPSKPDVMIVVAEIENLGAEPLHRALLELSCESFSLWSGIVVPIGLVKPGERARGEVGVPLRPGVDAREDEVAVRLRSDKRPAIDLEPVVLPAFSGARPEVAVSARLVGEGETRRAEVVVRNTSGVSMTGVQVYFASPGDLDVELIDASEHLALLLGGQEGAFELELRVGPDAPSMLPLELHVEAERYESVFVAPLELSGDSAWVAAAAPKVEAGPHLLSAPIGRYSLPVSVSDERRIDHVVVYVNGEKAVWAPGGQPKAALTAEVQLAPGANRLVVAATDDQGLVTKRLFVVRGEVPASVDADP